MKTLEPLSADNPKLVLEIRGMTVPCFKNRKHNGRTEPKIKQRMAEITRALESALRFSLATNGPGTQTECSRALLTALLTPSPTFDDSHQWIPKISVRVEKAEIPGATLEIEII